MEHRKAMKHLSPSGRSLLDSPLISYTDWDTAGFIYGLMALCVSKQWKDSYNSTWVPAVGGGARPECSPGDKKNQSKEEGNVSDINKY